MRGWFAGTVLVSYKNCLRLAHTNYFRGFRTTSRANEFILHLENFCAALNFHKSKISFVCLSSLYLKI